MKGKCLLARDGVWGGLVCVLSQHLTTVASSVGRWRV